MVERIVENYEFLNVIFANEPKYKHLQLKSEEVEVLEASLEVLKPFYDMTCEISSENETTLSLVIPIITTLIKVTLPKNDDEDITAGLKQMFQIFISFYQKKYGLLENKHLITATFLHPNFKNN